jgi:hypothetical protein
VHANVNFTYNSLPSASSIITLVIILRLGLEGLQCKVGREISMKPLNVGSS